MAALELRPSSQESTCLRCCGTRCRVPSISCLCTHSNKLHSSPALIRRMGLTFGANALKVQLVEEATLYDRAKFAPHDFKICFEHLCQRNNSILPNRASRLHSRKPLLVQ